MFRVLSGDLLTEEGWKLHQTNCTSKSVRGIAASIFAKWPETNTYYGDFERERKFGRNDIFGKIRVVNMNAQLNPGGPNGNIGDGIKDRLEAFETCLRDIEGYLLHPSNTCMTLSFPYGIGCGLAKGNWLDYMSLIHDSYERLQEQCSSFSVMYRIIRLPIR
jgi:hypothetical protein